MLDFGTKGFGEEDLRCCVDHDDAGDQDIEISEVEGCYFSENIASCENKGCKDEDAGHFPAFITSGRALAKQYWEVTND